MTAGFPFKNPNARHSVQNYVIPFMVPDAVALVAIILTFCCGLAV